MGEIVFWVGEAFLLLFVLVIAPLAMQEIERRERDNWSSRDLDRIEDLEEEKLVTEFHKAGIYLDEERRPENTLGISSGSVLSITVGTLDASGITCGDMTTDSSPDESYCTATTRVPIGTDWLRLVAGSTDD